MVVCAKANWRVCVSISAIRLHSLKQCFNNRMQSEDFQQYYVVS